MAVLRASVPRLTHAADEELHDELVAMAAIDQGVRQRAPRNGIDQLLPPALVAQWSQVDAANTARCRAVVGDSAIERNRGGGDETRVVAGEERLYREAALLQAKPSGHG